MPNSSTPRLSELLKVIHLAEGLKREIRHSWLSDGRQESVAEHTWRVCLMAILLEPELCLQIDGSRTLRMIVVHDLVEIFAGDIPIFSASTEDFIALAQLGMPLKIKQLIAENYYDEIGRGVYNIW